VFGLSATSNAIPSIQLGLYQSRLQQAQREAAQAQDKVRTLEAKTEQAQQEAAQAQDNVRSLESQPPRTQPALNTQGQVTGSLLSVRA
jgi:multidrug resistance efflux pump